MKTTVFYGSTTGTTEAVANRIAEQLGLSAADVKDVAKLDAADVAASDFLVLGSSTWGDGELQDDWYSALETLKACDLSAKTVALFGCGDSVSYCDTFCDAIGLIYEALAGKCRIIGACPTDGYTFDSSKSVVDGKFAGLPIDENNEDYKTDERIAAWVKQLQSELA